MVRKKLERQQPRTPLRLAGALVASLVPHAASLAQEVPGTPITPTQESIQNELAAFNALFPVITKEVLTEPAYRKLTRANRLQVLYG